MFIQIGPAQYVYSVRRYSGELLAIEERPCLVLSMASSVRSLSVAENCGVEALIIPKQRGSMAP